MKIYFAGSISGGREHAGYYAKLVSALKSNKHVILSEHVGHADVGAFEKNNSPQEIFERDVAWIDESDAVVADVTTPSIGVGWEVAYAQSIGKKVICLFHTDSQKRLSAMVGGNPKNHVVVYKTVEEALEKINSFLL